MPWLASAWSSTATVCCHGIIWSMATPLLHTLRSAHALLFKDKKKYVARFPIELRRFMLMVEEKEFICAVVTARFNQLFVDSGDVDSILRLPSGDISSFVLMARYCHVECLMMEAFAETTVPRFTMDDLCCFFFPLTGAHDFQTFGQVCWQIFICCNGTHLGESAEESLQFPNYSL